eukprot:NODE_14_length_42432_cov_0.433799.p13 type:complete len:341 gc:universal NODE_14_length_42432_cov_0.433799:23167-24189(+)
MILWEFNYFLRSNLTLVVDHPNFKKVIPLRLFYSYAVCHQDEFNIEDMVVLKLVKYTDIREEHLPFKSLLTKKVLRPDLTEFQPQYLLEAIIGMVEVDLTGLFDSMIMGKLSIDKDNYLEYVARVDEPLKIPDDKILIKCLFKSLNLDYLIHLKVLLNMQSRLLSLKSFNRAACFLVPIAEPLTAFICELYYKVAVVGKAELKFRIGEQSKHLMPEPSRFSLDILKKDVVLDVYITSSADVQPSNSVEREIETGDEFLNSNQNKLKSLLHKDFIQLSTRRKTAKSRPPLPFQKAEESEVTSILSEQTKQKSIRTDRALAAISNKSKTTKTSKTVAINRWK